MSELNVDTLQDAAGTGPINMVLQWGMKAAFFYKQTTTVSTDRGDNITSITDSAAGRFILNYTNNFDAADVAFTGNTESQTDAGSTDDSRINIRYPYGTYVTTSAMTLITSYNMTTTTRYDTESTGHIYGDLA